MKFINSLLQNTILIEYKYSESVLLSYKIWFVNQKTKKQTILKKVTTSLNPFLRLKPKSITQKKVEFKNI